MLPKSSWGETWLHCPITSQGSFHLQTSTANPKSGVWRETPTSQQYKIQCCMHAVNTMVWLGYLALPQYFRKPWKPFISSDPLGHLIITVSYDLRKRFPSVFQGLFVYGFADLDIKSWHLFPHPMNDFISHISWDRSTYKAILTLGSCNFHSLSELCQSTTKTRWRIRDHLDQIRVSSILAAASDMGQPWSTVSYPSPVSCSCQRSLGKPEKGSAWAHSTLSAHTAVTEIKANIFWTGLLHSKS